MAAANTDKLRKSKTLTSTTVGAGGVAQGGTSLLLGSTTNWPTDTALTIIVDRTDASGNLTLNKVEEITGVLNEDGVTFESLLRGENNTTDQAHAAGAVVELAFTGGMLNDMVDHGLAHANQDGTLKDDSVGTAQIADDAVDSAQIADGAIDLAHLSTAVLSAIYPVGSVYINASDDTNPATLMGFGTWSAFGAGKVPVSQDTGDVDFDTLEETGGAASVTLTAAQSGLPAHSHTSGTLSAVSGGAHTHTTQYNSGFRVDSGATAFIPETTGGSFASGIVQSGGAHTHTMTGSTANNSAAAASSSHTNLQPYIVVKMWKRTA